LSPPDVLLARYSMICGLENTTLPSGLPGGPDHSMFPLKRNLYRCTYCISAAVFSAISAVAAMGQSVLIPPPASSVGLPSTEIPESSNALEADEGGSGTEMGTSGETKWALQNAHLLRWGSVTLHPHLSYGLTYGSGVQSQPGRSQDTVIQSVSPGINFDVGKNWKLDYTSTLMFYSDNNFQNAVDHNLSLSGAKIFGDWRITLLQSAALNSDPQIQTASQTDQQNYSTALAAEYQLNDTFSLDLNASQNFSSVGSSFTNSVGDTRAWSTMDWLNYRQGPFGAGFGMGFGYNAVQQGGNNNIYEMYQGNVSWHVMRKINFSLNGGAQIMQFLDSTQPDVTSPMFGASLSYVPFQYTTFTISANHNVSVSTYFVNQLTETTGFHAGLSQRLLGRLSLNFAGGYSDTSYHLSQPVPGFHAFSVTRKDSTSFYSISLSTSFLKRGNASVSYSKSQSSSSSEGFGFSSNQFGFQLSYAY
jgi:hypothetical protein